MRNLILSQAVYDKAQDTKKAAFLAGINLGEINHCILRDCTIENLRDDGEFGNISSRNEGIIANCQLLNIRFKNEVKVGSGITRYHYGKIINCAVNNCQFKKTSMGGGLICNLIKTEKYKTVMYRAISANATLSASKYRKAMLSGVVFIPKVIPKLPSGTITPIPPPIHC